MVGSNSRRRRQRSSSKSKPKSSQQQAPVPTKGTTPAPIPTAPNITHRNKTYLIEAGFLAEPELARIKRGNSQFDYPTSTTYGRRVRKASFRCLHCPTACTSYESYLRHQTTIHNFRGYECRLCSFRTRVKKLYFSHCQNHARAARNPNYGHTGLTTSEEESDSEAPPPNNENNNNGQRQGQVQEESPPPPPAVVEPLPAEVENKLILAIELSQFMKFETIYLNLAENEPNFHQISGGVDDGKTTIILGILLGLGYDLALDLPGNGTLCGVKLNSVVSTDAPQAVIDVTLNTTSIPPLLAKYGKRLTLKRIIPAGGSISKDSSFQADYTNNLTRSPIVDLSLYDAKIIAKQIFPTQFARLMILCGENVDYYMKNFHELAEAFSETTILKKSVAKLSNQALLKKIECVEDFKGDLDSRQDRIKSLEHTIPTFSSDSFPKVKFSPVITKHAKKMSEELIEAKSKWKEINNIYEKELEEKVELEKAQEKSFVILCKELAKTFGGRLQEFLASQNFDDVNFINDIIDWIQKTNTNISTNTGKNLAESRRILRNIISVHNKQLVVIGLYLGFWTIFDGGIIPPLLLSDGFSTKSSSFNLPPSTFNIMGDIICSAPKTQFICTIPLEEEEEMEEDNNNNFVQNDEENGQEDDDDDVEENGEVEDDEEESESESE